MKLLPHARNGALLVALRSACSATARPATAICTRRLGGPAPTPLPATYQD
jgi:hypothetical protein